MDKEYSSSNRGISRMLSNNFIRWLIAHGITKSSAAASLTLLTHAKISNFDKQLMGGILRISKIGNIQN
jgi:hypothetical protein